MKAFPTDKQVSVISYSRFFSNSRFLVPVCVCLYFLSLYRLLLTEQNKCNARVQVSDGYAEEIFLYQVPLSPSHGQS